MTLAKRLLIVRPDHPTDAGELPELDELLAKFGDTYALKLSRSNGIPVMIVMHEYLVVPFMNALRSDPATRCLQVEAIGLT
jgi:hypothetical protein